MDLQATNKLMTDAVQHLEQEFAKIQVGRASTSMVEDMLVDAYGQSQPLKNVATITTPESNSLMIQPWDKAILGDVERSIRDRSDMGFNPQNDGNVLRIVLPQPTEERRKEWVKVAHQKGEEARISIRNARHKAHDWIKSQQKEGEISEDEARALEKELQEQTDKANKSVEDHVQTKEKEIMTV